MKRIFSIIAISLAGLGMLSCQIDNYDGPNAGVHGYFVDTKDNTTLVGTDSHNGNQITVYEQTFVQDMSNPETWYIMNTGEYNNSRIFAADYKIEFKNTNFYPYAGNIEWKVGRGNNERNFEVTPFLRVINPKIELVGENIIATFKVEAGGPDVKIAQARLFAWSDKYVGNSFTYNIQGTAVVNNLEVVNPDKEYKLIINKTESKSMLKYHRNYYFRIGVLAKETNSPAKYGTIRHNYSPTVTIQL